MQRWLLLFHIAAAARAAEVPFADRMQLLLPSIDVSAQYFTVTTEESCSSSPVASVANRFVELSARCESSENVLSLAPTSPIYKYFSRISVSLSRGVDFDAEADDSWTSLGRLSNGTIIGPAEILANEETFSLDVFKVWQDTDACPSNVLERSAYLDSRLELSSFQISSPDF